MRRLWTLPFLLLAIAYSAVAQKVSEDSLYAQAQALETKEKFTEALGAYEVLLKEYPTGKYGAEALYRMGLLYSNNLHDFRKSLEVYRRIIERYPESKFTPQAQFMIGYLHANELREYDKAREAYNTFLQKYPNHELVLSVKWELENMGKDVNEIQPLKPTPEQKNPKSDGKTESAPAKKQTSKGKKAKK